MSVPQPVNSVNPDRTVDSIAKNLLVQIGSDYETPGNKTYPQRLADVFSEYTNNFSFKYDVDGVAAHVLRIFPNTEVKEDTNQKTATEL